MQRVSIQVSATHRLQMTTVRSHHAAPSELRYAASTLTCAAFYRNVAFLRYPQRHSAVGGRRRLCHHYGLRSSRTHATNNVAES
jgi:hypothetical protein